MAIFKLNNAGDDLEDAELVEASPSTLGLEKHLEAWLERSPWAIAQEPLMVVGRQTSAAVDNGTVFPDLLALGKDGNLVIVELKKGRAPRDVMAQILEYAAWASVLTKDDIIDLAANYLRLPSDRALHSVTEAFCTTFETDELPSLNGVLRLFIAAEEIPQSVARVCRFLRTKHSVDVHCVEFSVFQTTAGEILVSSECIVGQEETVDKRRTAERWSGDKSVKQVVWEAAHELTRGLPDFVFSPRDVAEVVLTKYPGFNKSTVGCQIISDCVNHSSRQHYSGGEDRYWWLGKGKYRLFNPATDKL